MDTEFHLHCEFGVVLDMVMIDELKMILKAVVRSKTDTCDSTASTCLVRQVLELNESE